jgi:hypothetical protein
MTRDHLTFQQSMAIFIQNSNFRRGIGGGCYFWPNSGNSASAVQMGEPATTGRQAFETRHFIDFSTLVSTAYHKFCRVRGPQDYSHHIANHF